MLPLQCECYRCSESVTVAVRVLQLQCVTRVNVTLCDTFGEVMFEGNTVGEVMFKCNTVGEVMFKCNTIAEVMFEFQSTC